MALKPQRTQGLWDISAFMNSTAERGGIVSFSSATASGVAMDQAEMTVDYVANPSGVVPFGMLMQDVVNKDLTQTFLDPYKDEVQVGSKVATQSICEVTTDRIYPGHTPSAGSTAYIGHSGYIASADVANDDSDSTGATRIVGQFRSAKDENGFAKVRINIVR